MQDQSYVYEVTDAGAQRPQRVKEELIRVGDRVVSTYDGKPYATWVVKDSGVWRQDPKGGGALLRYLPPTLKENTYWKQVSGNAEVWFSLIIGGDACFGIDTNGPCWTVRVLNRGELTEFAFAVGRGPLAVVDENRRNPGESFRKRVIQEQAGTLNPADRDNFVKAAPGAQGTEVSVEEVTREAFNAAIQKEPILIADLIGSGRAQYLFVQGARVIVQDADGRTLLESTVGEPTSFERIYARAIDLPGRPPLVQITERLMCLKSGPASTFVWYDSKTSQFQVTPQHQCLSYTYQGKGQFEVSGGTGTPLYYEDQAHWSDGQFVTDRRTYNLVLRYLYPEGLGWVLQVIAEQKVGGEELLFNPPGLLQEFKSKTGKGSWTFADAQRSGDQIRYTVSFNGQPHGHLTVRTGPPTNVSMHVDPGNIQIYGLVWSD